VLRVREFLDKKSITKVDHPPYSPDLGLNNFWLYPKLKNALKGQRFAGIPDIQHNIMLLRDILENDFQDCYWKWQHCLTKHIVSQAEYFEGDCSR
jgi:hypothetical protein